MKQINFIKTLSPGQQQQLRTWLIISSLLCSIVFIFIAIVQINQVRTYYAVLAERRTFQEQAQSFDVIMDKKHKNKEQEQALKKQVAKINRRITQPKTPRDYLATIDQACANTVELTSLSIKKKDIELTIACNKPEDATTFINTLAQSPHFAHMRLVSLKPVAKQDQNDRLHVAIKGIAKS